MAVNPMANKILSYKKIDNKTFSFVLTGVERPKRNLTIHIIDNQKGIAIFEEIFDNKNKLYYLMIDATKIKQFPIIVNYCKNQNKWSLILTFLTIINCLNQNMTKGYTQQEVWRYVGGLKRNLQLWCMWQLLFLA
jgi:hypothetical protein